MNNTRQSQLLKEWAANREHLVLSGSSSPGGNHMLHSFKVKQTNHASPTRKDSRSMSQPELSNQGLDDILNGKSVPKHRDLLETLENDRYVVRGKKDDDSGAPLVCTKNVLIFDEDDYEKVDTVKTFEEIGFDVEEVGDLDQAVSIFFNKGHTFDVIAIGLRGPSYQTLRFLEQIAPLRIPVLLTINKQQQTNTSEKSSRSVRKLGAGRLDELSYDEAIALAMELGASIKMNKPLQTSILETRITEAMDRYAKAASTFRNMLEMSDPDFITNQAKQLVVRELAEKHQKRKTILTSIRPVGNDKPKVKKETIDMQGKHAKKSKFALALKRSKAHFNAKLRVEAESERRKVEARYTKKTFDPRYREKRRRSTITSKVRKSIVPGEKPKTISESSAPTDHQEAIGDQGTVVDRLAKNAWFQSLGKAANEKRKTFQTSGLGILTEMAKKKNKEEGRLPLLKDFKGTISYIRLPWEVELQKKQVLEFGKVPKPVARDVLEDAFRENGHKGSAFVTSSQRFLQKGMEKKTQGDLLSAIKLYTRAMNADPRYGPAYLCRGVAYYVIGDSNNAMKDFSDCIRIDPENIDARFNRAILFVNEFQDESAIDELNEAIELNPDDEGLYHFRAFIYRRMGDFVKSQEDYKTHGLLKAKRISERLERKRLRKERKKKLAEAYARTIGGDPDDYYDDSSDDSDAEELLRSMSRPTSPTSQGQEEDEDNEENDQISEDGESNDEGDEGGDEDQEEKDEDDENWTHGMTKKGLLNSFKQRHQSIRTKRKWDTNHDGRVDLAEFTAATQDSDSVYASLFQKKSQIEAVCDKSPDQRTKDDLLMIERAMTEIRLFRNMPRRQLRTLSREIKLMSVLPGEYVIQQGDPSRNFFAVLEGELIVTVTMSDMDSEHIVNRLTQGMYFGETGILSDTKRGANILCPNDGDVSLVFVVSKNLFIRENLDYFVREDRGRIAKILRSVMIFNDMDEQSFLELAKITRPAEYPHNSVIIRQGEPASRFCILVSGICKTLKYQDPGADLIRRKRVLLHQIEQFEMTFAVHHANTQTSEALERASKAFALNDKRKKELEDIEQQLEDFKSLSGERHPRKKLVHSQTVYPGNVFGEETLLDPFYGREQYTVVADTYVSILIVHKDQLQNYRYTNSLLEKVRRKKLIA